MSAVIRHVSKSGINRITPAGNFATTNAREPGMAKSIAMKSKDWRRTAHSLTSFDDAHSTNGIHVDDRSKSHSSEEFGSYVLDMDDDDASLDHNSWHLRQNTSLGVAKSALATKPELSDGDISSAIDYSSDEADQKEYVVVEKMEPYKFKLGGENGEVFESKKISTIDVRLAADGYMPCGNSWVYGPWCVLKRAGEGDAYHSNQVVHDLGTSDHEGGHSQKEGNSLKTVSADTSIHSIGGVDVESPDRRKELPTESKLRFLDLVRRLKRSSGSCSRTSPEVVSHHISNRSIGSEDSAKAVAGVPTNVERGCNKPQGKKLDPTAAEFRTVESVLRSPLGYFPKKLSRPALGNIFPEAAHIGQDHQTSPLHYDATNATYGAISEPVCGSGVPHPSSSFNEIRAGFPSWSNGHSSAMPAMSFPEEESQVNRFNTVPPAHFFMERHNPCPSSQYLSTMEIGSAPPLVNMNGVDVNYPCLGPPFNSFPQQAQRGYFASTHQGLQGLPSLTNMQTSMPPLLPTLGYTKPAMGQHSGMPAPFAGSTQLGPTASHGTSGGPLFPITRKPRGNDPWQQMEYERFLEWRKANEPGYHMSCKMRQAQRVIRQHHQQQDSAA